MTIERLVTVKRSKRARRVALRLDPVDRVVNLIVPPRMPLERAYFFAQTHEDWVREHLASLSAPIRFVDGAKLPIFGETVTLRIERSSLYQRTSIERTPRILRVYTNLKDPTDKIVAYLRKVARERLEEMSLEKAATIRRRVASVRVRETKSRWGSCAQDGSLNFSWRLIFAPYVAIDYVVAHEVAHLRYMDHSASFWALCESLCLDYDEGKSWMRLHGNELMRYGG